MARHTESRICKRWTLPFLFCLPPQNDKLLVENGRSSESVHKHAFGHIDNCLTKIARPNKGHVRGFSRHCSTP